jgi:hypothetical protein
LVALIEGQTRFEAEAVLQTLAGDKMHVIISLSVAPGDEETWAKVFVSVIDITERKQAKRSRTANARWPKHCAIPPPR